MLLHVLIRIASLVSPSTGEHRKSRHLIGHEMIVPVIPEMFEMSETVGIFDAFFDFALRAFFKKKTSELQTLCEFRDLMNLSLTPPWVEEE